MPLGQKYQKLLRWGFSEVEWQYLMGDQSFATAVTKADDTVDAVEKLSDLGEKLIQEWEERGKPLSSN